MASFATFLPPNSSYGIGRNHGSNAFRYCFLLHRPHSASAERTTERLSVGITVTFALKCTFADTDSTDPA
jgi:hypothetical protein